MENSTLIFNPKEKIQTLRIENSGDATAKNVKIRIYIKDDLKQIAKVPRPDVVDWHILEDYSDKPEFANILEYARDLSFLDAKDSALITLGFLSWRIDQPKLRIPALLKIYYGQPEPKEIPFTIEFRSE